MKKKQLQRIENEHRQFSIVPSTLNLEARTVELVFSTGSRGKRYDYNIGSYYEELEISENAIKLERLNSGAPLLFNHQSYSSDDVIGVVERAWVDGTEAKALVRFDTDDYADKIFRKVKSGILKHVSVQYSADYEHVGEADGIPVMRAVNWEPIEISVLPLPFDYNAQIRAKNLNQTKIEEKVDMSKKEDGAQPSVEPQIDKSAELVQRAVEDERKRCIEIRKLVREFKFNDELAEEYITNNQTVSQVKTNLELFRKYEKESEQTPVVAAISAKEETQQNHTKRRELIETALLHRIDSSNELTPDAREYAGMSLVRVMEKHLGRNPYESDVDFVKRTMTTSDLPQILSNVAQKSAQKRYALTPKTFELWTTKGTLKDYKPSLQVRGGDVGSLQKIMEKGEYKQQAIGEEYENAQLEKYGVMHSFSDIMLINDDLGLILDIARESGVAQARLDNQLAYAALTSNPAMSDGFNVFSAEHGNLGTAGAIGDTTFAEAFTKMRQQKSVDGRDQLNITPKYLIVGPTLEFAAKKFLAVIQPNATTDVNVFSNSVELIVDAAIEDDSYYFVADPRLHEGVKINRLQGMESVRVDSRVKWDNDAIQLKLSYAAQAKAMDYRALFMNEVGGE